MKNSIVSDHVLNFASDLIKQFEGCSLNAYLCPANVWTIGYGHTKNVKSNDVITQNQAEEFLKNDILTSLSFLDKIVFPLADNQKIALISFVFNVGINNFLNSTMLKKLNNQDFFGAAQEFDRWIYAKGKILKGLQRRRKVEKEIFLS